MNQINQEFTQAIAAGKLITLATRLSGENVGSKLLIRPDGTTAGTLGTAALDKVVIERAVEVTASQKSQRMELPDPGNDMDSSLASDSGSATDELVDIFIEVHAPPPRLVVVGAVHISIHLVTMAKALGYYTIVVDARSAFATPERFPHADRLITQWPADALDELGIDESSMIVVLTHDEKLDNPALEVAIQSPALYVGALGSKKTHAKRVGKLKEAGMSDEQISRIHAPIGLNLGGRKPEEIAVSIIAEIVAVRNGAE